MNPSRTIPTAPFEHAAMDFAFLRREGIRQLERLAGQLWTDFNAHDPGITILEQVCYAMTDLAYRINHDLPDLLARGDEQADNSLYSPAQVLTTHPVTQIDLRKLAIDVAGVKNAWVEKVAEPFPPLYFHAGENALRLQGETLTAEPVFLNGLYRVLIEISDLLVLKGKAEPGEAVRNEVARRLHAHRGLCEDFVEIRQLDQQKIQVHARIEIAAVDDAESVLLAIYQRIADYISPPVRFFTLNQMREAGKRIDEIFDGPLLEHGFIDSEALAKAQRKTALHTSDLVREIMDVVGVQAIRDISISAGSAPQAWSLDLDPDRAPRLDLPGSTISLERNRLPASVDKDKVVKDWHKRLRDAALQKPTSEELDVQPPPGQNRHVGRYHSLQHQFPATYGIGAMGLPDSATPRRKAQAKQLKAYLLFFDQLLANYFSQLAHARDLFSFSDSAARTYFSQPIDDPSLGLEGIYHRAPDAFRSKLQEITENPRGADQQPGFDRRNRFLNHLLARFAEQFTDYSLILFGAMPKEGVTAAEKLVQDKQRFLQDYPGISSARGTAFNELMPRGPENRSGLEERLRRKLGIVEKEEDFLLIEHILLRPMAEDVLQQVPILADPRHKDPYSLQISFVFPDWPPRFANAGFRAFVERTIREETPAHLIVYIHWLDRKAMAAFESAYREWLDKRRAYNLKR